ncbi:Os07g0139150 [Oryza sativa Japonica Group]|uniref:ABC transporter-like protein n=3 Tax=Oryza sativa TaxID=4530 RepID=Q6ZDZ6_ORYSJ|nr:hypothetical protein OsI_24838 [Oryza sativa Indica Group]BAC45052.1 ABC transporter-like protein [Oryza sativa Japonica Group]BAC83498.1 ABC transporter-like protein [Oryza sativa Japonica Group]BAS99994.1 Os07g0139150 [Oryza sativa Japonica Group]
MTIHQPSGRILNILDRLLFLSRGRTVRLLRHAVGAQDLLLRLRRARPGQREPSREFALDTIGELEHHSTTAPPCSSNSTPSGNHRSALSSSMPTYANPPYVEVWVLIKRAFTNTRRMPELLVMRLRTITVTGFILATIFWRLDRRHAQGSPGAAGLLNSPWRCRRRSTSAPTRCRCSSRSATSTSGIETAHNAYRRLSYVIANTAVAFPPLVSLSLAFAATTFFAVGLSGGGAASPVASRCSTARRSSGCRRP